jgi:hypothetical protein
MNLLQKLEQHLCQIDMWPTYIIRCLFIVFPKPSIVRKLTALFYGKDITVSFASQLYNACNDKYNHHVTEYIYHLYSHGQRCMYLLAYLPTPWSRVLLDKLTVNFAASQEIPRIYGNRKFLTVLTKCMYKIHMSEYYNVRFRKFI